MDCSGDQIPVPEYIDVLLVEQEVIGDDRTALKVRTQAHAFDWCSKYRPAQNQ